MPENIQDKLISAYDYKEYDIAYPVIITRWKIMQVNGLDKRYLQVYFQKISDTVKAFKFNVKCYSDYGEVENLTDISLQEIDKKDLEFSKVVPLKSEIKKVEINIQQCLLLDNSMVEPKGKQMVVNTFKPFNEEDSEAGKRLLPNAKGYPIDNLSHWYCACGKLNIADSKKCISCKLEKNTVFEKITEENIKQENSFIQNNNAEQIRNRRKRKKLITIISCVAVVICILVGIFVGTFAPLQNVTVDGMTFEKEKDGYVLTRYNDNSSTVNIPSIIRGKKVIEIGNGAFYNTNIINVTIPESVISIGLSAFSECKSLTHITIPDSIVCIGAFAFKECNVLSSLIIGEGVATIGKGAFKDCTAVTEIKYNAVNCLDLTGGSGNDNEVFFNVGKRGNGTRVTIGKNVKRIPDYLFYSYYPLHANDDLYTPKIISIEFEKNSICTVLGSFAFGSCRSLTSITIPDSVTSISSSTFEGCNSLTNIIIPNSVTSIGSYAFRGCKNLTIYAEALNQPSNWTSNWNVNSYPVVWGYKG